MKGNKMYRNILFDLYGTLIDLKTDEEKHAFWESLSLFFSYNGAQYTCDELKTKYLELVAHRLAENIGTRYPDTKIILVLQALYAEKGVKASDELLDHTTKLFRAASTEYIRLYPGVRELLDALRENKKNLYILSNGQREFSAPELRHLGIYDSFKALYSSAEIGVCKPDKQFFDFLLKKEGLNPKECLFVGNDSQTDILGANAAGMDSVYIHSNQSRNVTETTATYEIWDGDVSKVLSYALAEPAG
ncbi:MAG TPA: HAD family hydrolase [Caproicibacter sp.]|nr:HAD family hydrolase [Caproicibacter sp.]